MSTPILEQVLMPARFDWLEISFSKLLSAPTPTRATQPLPVCVSHRLALAS